MVLSQKQKEQKVGAKRAFVPMDLGSLTPTATRKPKGGVDVHLPCTPRPVLVPWVTEGVT